MTQIKSREAAIAVLWGKVILEKNKEETLCRACGTTIPPDSQAIAVVPQGDGKPVGPFCQWLCKSLFDDHVLKLALGERN